MSQEDCSYANSISCECPACPTKQVPQTTLKQRIRPTTIKPTTPMVKDLDEDAIWPHRLPVPIYRNKSHFVQDDIYSEGQFYEVGNRAALSRSHYAVITMSLFIVLFS